MKTKLWIGTLLISLGLKLIPDCKLRDVLVYGIVQNMKEIKEDYKSIMHSKKQSVIQK